MSTSTSTSTSNDNDDVPLEIIFDGDDPPMTVVLVQVYLTKGQAAGVAIQTVVSCVTILLCITIILAMLFPLLEKEKRARASAYNLYLVFLAIPDLVFNIFLVYLFSTYKKWVTIYDSTTATDNQQQQLVTAEVEDSSSSSGSSSSKRVDHPFDQALFMMCVTAHLYMNLFISYEILKLLRNSKLRKRSKPPTLRRATSQAVCAYTLGVIIFVLDYFAGEYLLRLPLWIIGPIYFGIQSGLPISYVMWVCFRIWYEQLLSHDAGRRLKLLVIYFSIIILYVFILFPVAILYILLSLPSILNIHIFLYLLACLLYAIQSWFSFGLAMTKPDVRLEVFRLFALKPCRRMCSFGGLAAALDDNENDNVNDNDNDNNNPGNTNNKSKHKNSSDTEGSWFYSFSSLFRGRTGSSRKSGSLNTLTSSKRQESGNGDNDELGESDEEETAIQVFPNTDNEECKKEIEAEVEVVPEENSIRIGNKDRFAATSSVRNHPFITPNSSMNDDDDANTTQSVENRTNNAFVSSSLEVIYYDESSCEGDEEDGCNVKGK